MGPSTQVSMLSCSQSLKHSSDLLFFHTSINPIQADDDLIKRNTAYDHIEALDPSYHVSIKAK